MPKAKENRRTAAEDFVAKHPWAGQKHPAAKKRKVDDGAPRGDNPDSDDSDDQASGSSTGSDSESEDVAVSDVFSELQAARDKWHADHGHQGVDDFGGGLLGGFFTRTAFGEVTDYAACEATSAEAQRFVQRYGLQASKRCKLLRYGSDVASHLALGWAHKMQYFLDLYRAAGDTNYVFTAEDHNAYQEPPYFTKVADGGAKEIMSVVNSIRKIRPSRPVDRR